MAGMLHKNHVTSRHLLSAFGIINLIILFISCEFHFVGHSRTCVIKGTTASFETGVLCH